MDNAERNTQEYPREGYTHIEPVIDRNIFRMGPRPHLYGFTRGGTAVSNELNDNDHCRIVFVPKPAVAGGSVSLARATEKAQYTFKSSYDEKPAD